jgi:hypothetical protein
VVSFYAKIVFIAAFNMYSATGKIKIVCLCFEMVGMYYFKHIIKRQGIENGLKIMKAITAFVKYIQSEIDLAIRKNDHGFMNLIAVCTDVE